MSWRAPLILLLAGFTLSASVILCAEIVYGQERRYQDPYQEDRGRRTQQQFYQLPPPPREEEKPDTIPDQIAAIFLDQGWIGAMMLLLMGYLHISQKTARTDRLRLEEKLFSLTEKTNETLAEQKTEHEKHGSELQNISRELERIRG
jgi:hypothetical protein